MQIAALKQERARLSALIYIGWQAWESPCFISVCQLQHSVQVLIQNLDSFLPCNVLLEEPCFKVCSASTHDWIQSVSRCLFVSFEMYWHVSSNHLIYQCLGPI